MNKETIFALTRMGYRILGKDVWAKPVGFHLLAVKDYKLKNYFIGANKKMLVWDSHDIDSTDPLNSIKSAEYSTRLNVGMLCMSNIDLSFVSKSWWAEGLL